MLVDTSISMSLQLWFTWLFQRCKLVLPAHPRRVNIASSYPILSVWLPAWQPVKNIQTIRLFSQFARCHHGVSNVHSGLWCVDLLFTIHCFDKLLTWLVKTNICLYRTELWEGCCFDCQAKHCMLQTTVLIRSAVSGNCCKATIANTANHHTAFVCPSGATWTCVLALSRENWAEP